MPGMVDPWRPREPILADDLGIQMQRGTGFAPCLEGDVGPDRVHGGSSLISVRFEGLKMLQRAAAIAGDQRRFQTCLDYKFSNMQSSAIVIFQNWKIIGLASIARWLRLDVADARTGALGNREKVS